MRTLELSVFAGNQNEKDIRARKLVVDQRKIIKETIALIQKIIIDTLREGKPLMGYDQLYDKIFK